MNIYRLTRECHRMDEVKGFVIAADSAYEARRLAMQHHMDEGPQVWRSSLVKVELIGYTDKWRRPYLIMQDDWGV